MTFPLMSASMLGLTKTFRPFGLLSDVKSNRKPSPEYWRRRITVYGLGRLGRFPPGACQVNMETEFDTKAPLLGLEEAPSHQLYG